MSSKTPAEAPYDGPERRAVPRIPAAAVPYLTASVAGGPAVRLIDLSKRGVHLESTLRMPPGSTVAIRFVSGNASMTLTGAVVRSACAVLQASGEVTYHTALAFADELTLCAEELDAAAQSVASSPPPASQGDDYTMIVIDGRVGAHAHGSTDTAC